MAEQYDIVLIFPPIRVWDRPRNFPSGTGIIAAILRNAGYKVKVIDVNGLRISQEEVVEQTVAASPKIIGLGGLITTYGWIKSITPMLKEKLPGRKIMLGGSVGTSIVETALANLNVDVITIAEADDTVLELVPALLEGRSLKDIAGLAYLEDGEVVRTEVRPMIDDLNRLPLPAWDMFPMDVYLANPVVGVGKDVDIISSRGCPFPCRYCYRIFGRKYRTRSAEHVVSEVERLCHDYDVDFISFQDDCFVVDKKRVYAICDLLDEKGLSKRLRWSCTGRVTVCDLEMMKRMRASGCVSISYGIESGSETILKAMGKNASLEQAANAINNARAAGVRTPVSFMIGYPGETRDTVMETVAFCKKMNIPLGALMFTCPYPGTPLYEEVRHTEQFKSQFATEEEFVLELGDALDFVVNMTELSKEELFVIRDEALAIAKGNYIPPTAEEVEAQERELYGEELYAKAKAQMETPEMQAHRKRHGFNEKQ